MATNQTTNYTTWKALDLFFDKMMEGLKGHVDGTHYFDTLSTDCIFEFKYNFPGWPTKTTSRQELMDLYSGYGKNVEIQKVDSLVVTQADHGGVVVLEYEVHGKIKHSGGDYNNRFISVAVVQNRKIVNWRDYMDSLVAFTALSSK